MADNLEKKLIAFRRDLHRHPELSFQESRTAEKVADYLKSLSLKPQTGIAKTGVVVDIPGRKTKNIVALRADMDALPLTEQTGLEFSSEVDGVMHACGHDGHTTMLLGAAEILSQTDNLPATVRLIFQPAEETGEGAKAMIEEGVLKDVAMIFGGHLDRHFAPGKIVVTEGPVNASTDAFAIEIEGKGGHGARPHEAVDAVVVGSLIVMSLQTIVSREVNPAHPSVVTIGAFEAGTAPNVIAASATLKGTVRAQHKEVREHIVKSIGRISETVGQIHGANVNLKLISGTPPVSNSCEMAELCRLVVRDTFGETALAELSVANMGGEDFGYFLEKIPGAYVRVGGQIEGREDFPAHSSQFDFDEKALLVGAQFYSQLAIQAGSALGEE